MKLVLVGVSHHRAAVELRELVAVERDAAAALARTIAGHEEAVVLSTCNRTEIYMAADEDDELEQRAAGALVGLAGEQGAELAPVLYRLADESAALHLFRVAAGLDSLVPGEGEILVPGERGSRTARERLEDGEIDIEDNLLAELRRVAARPAPPGSAR